MNIALFHKGLIWWGFIKRENKLKNFILLLSWFILLVNPILQSKYLLGKLNFLQTILFLLITLIFFFVWNLKDIHFKIYSILSEYSREMKSSKVYFKTNLNRKSVDVLVSTINKKVKKGDDEDKDGDETINIKDLSEKIKKNYNKFENIKSGEFSSGILSLWVDKQSFFSERFANEFSSYRNLPLVLLLYIFYLFVVLIFSRAYYLIPILALQVVANNIVNTRDTILFLEDTVPEFEFNSVDQIYKLMIQLEGLFDEGDCENNVFIRCVKKLRDKYYDKD